MYDATTSGTALLLKLHHVFGYTGVTRFRGLPFTQARRHVG